MRLIVGAVLLVLLGVMALTASESEAGRKRIEQILTGALVIAGAVYFLARAGLPWLAVGLVVLYVVSRRIGDWSRPNGRNTEVKASRAPMSREEAYQVLGLAPGASPDQIRAEYRRLMKKMHPDQGGTTYLAARINEAKDVLLD